jgi:hypothetical protein
MAMEGYAVKYADAGLRLDAGARTAESGKAGCYSLAHDEEIQ